MNLSKMHMLKLVKEKDYSHPESVDLEHLEFSVFPL